MVSGLIYSAVFGGKDIIRGGFPTIPDVTYLMITDRLQEEVPAPWSYANVLPVVSPRWTNRLFKWNMERLQPWLTQSLDWVLYIDGSMTPTKALTDELLKKWLGGPDTVMFKHPHRTDVFQEYVECVKLKKMGKNMKLYTHLQKTAPKGLWAGGIVLRRPKASPSPSLVFEGIEQFRCLRDQLIIPTIYPQKFITTINESIWANPYFRFTKHGG